nr:programmed cell death 1 ligand 1-like isoform X2 [Pelodiscus sinensis]|eukprot:XP_025036519.1 programmed cell death 1 ligand 1-like isoform X2 [Pelodiscus sinensis]
MFGILLILILQLQLYLIRAFFTVEVPQQLYIAKYGSNVTMECRFPVDGQLNLKDLRVSWAKKELQDQKSKEVYTLQKGEEDLKSQHSDYRGRATLLHDKLNLGYSVLQITNVKLMDAGSYRCLIDYRGADYKYITLKVKAQRGSSVGKKSLILFIIPTCIIAVILISALIIFLKRKSLTKLHVKKGKKRKSPQLHKEDNRDMNPQTQDLIMTNVTDSKDCMDVCP